MGWLGKKVLIVDDMEHVRSQIESMFSGLGLEVIGKVADGVDALEFCESEMPDLLSIDIIMPEMDGIEFFRQMRRRFGDAMPPALFISYLASEPKVVEAYAEEIEPKQFLPKGCSAELVRTRLDDIFGAESKVPQELSPASEDAGLSEDTTAHLGPSHTEDSQFEVESSDSDLDFSNEEETTQQ